MILRILLFGVKPTVMEKRSEYFIFYRKPVCEAVSEMSVYRDLSDKICEISRTRYTYTKYPNDISLG